MANLSKLFCFCNKKEFLFLNKSNNIGNCFSIDVKQVDQMFVKLETNLIECNFFLPSKCNFQINSSKNIHINISK